MAVLVTGGAGYIGSVTVKLLIESGEEVVVLDNLSHGHIEAIDPAARFYEGDMGDEQTVAHILREHDIDSCIHFAAFIAVGESVEHPAKYYDNNVRRALALLTTLNEGGVKHLVFSSTAATYGEPQRMPIDEDHPQHPENPYGWSKYMIERVLEDFDAAYGFRSVALRYFNACGALPGCGEDHHPETHLIPLILQTALGQRDAIKIFGTDYPTPDGTCVRDYVHVADLGLAHLLSLAYLRHGGGSARINLGNGNGYTVKQVIETAREVTGATIAAVEVERRAGDTSHLVADSSRARELLNWQPRFPELREIVATAWEWHSHHPNGYKS